MTEEQFRKRTKQYGLRIIRLGESLPQSRTAWVIGPQLLRAGTSVGANYRAACRGKSVADTLVKRATVEEETDESLYWMEVLIAAELVPAHRLHALMQEGDEIAAMTVSPINTLRRRK